jgi:hypothetical protein
MRSAVARGVVRFDGAGELGRGAAVVEDPFTEFSVGWHGEVSSRWELGVAVVDKRAVADNFVR